MSNIFNILKTVLSMDKFFDLFKGKERRLLEFQQELANQLQQANFKQIDVNIQEAKHKSIFVAGWRPFIGWVCGSALAYQFILRDLIGLILGTDKIPTLDITQLITILLAMLGMGGLRTYEKLKNKA